MYLIASNKVIGQIQHLMSQLNISDHIKGQKIFASKVLWAILIPVSIIS